MARLWRVRYAGAKYHVTVRGNGRQDIFVCDGDRERFLAQLVSALEQDQVVLYAYVLMTNHYHLLIETPRGNIQRFMQRLNTAYSLYFRYKHAKPGHCLQGRYGAKLVAGDEYLVRLSRYIHLNPVKTEAMKSRPPAEKAAYLAGYAWSSYAGYVSAKGAVDYVNYRWLPLMGRATLAGNRRAYARYVAQILGVDDAEFQEEKEASRYAIGDERFRRQVEQDLKDVREHKGVYGDIVWPIGQNQPVEAIQNGVAAAFGVERKDLLTHGRRAGTAKKVALELCCLYSGQSQREIGRHFGFTGNGAVGKQRQRLRELLTEDHALAVTVERLRRKLKSP